MKQGEAGNRGKQEANACRKQERTGNKGRQEAGGNRKHAEAGSNKQGVAESRGNMTMVEGGSK